MFAPVELKIENFDLYSMRDKCFDPIRATNSECHEISCIYFR